jgi:DNA mismatch repair protein MutS
VKQARAYLARLDQFSARRDGQGDLFAEAATAQDGASSHPGDALLDRLATLDPDALSPREALAALYELRQLAKGPT